MRIFLIAAVMLTGGSVRLGAQVPVSEYEQRRAALASRLGDGVMIVRGGEEPPQDYLAFFQTPAFLYLTGFREAGAALVMRKRGADVQWTLFVQSSDAMQEVWSGTRYGPHAASSATGIPARAETEFSPALDSLLNDSPRAYFLGSISEGGDTLNGDARFVRELRERHPSLVLTGINRIVAQMRGRKSAAELDLIQRAAAISLEGHREAARVLKPGMNEFEIQALIEYTFRRYGAGRPAYSSIVGSGANSTTLHYNRDDRFMKAGELVVIDAAAEYAGYAADVTRTLPVSGTFTSDQREVYQIVRDAQAAAERTAKPGVAWSGVSEAARRVLAEGLARLGLIESPTAVYDCAIGGSQQSKCSQVSLYYMHELGHGIGLEVHDPDQFYVPPGKIDQGSAFTLEPGIYVREKLLDMIPDTPSNRVLIAKIAPAVKRFANIGIRIEDDYIVTDGGLEWITCAPREAREVEALMRDSSTGPAPRDAAVVDWYRGIGVDPRNTRENAVPKPKSCTIPKT